MLGWRPEGQVVGVDGNVILGGHFLTALGVVDIPAYTFDERGGFAVNVLDAMAGFKLQLFDGDIAALATDVHLGRFDFWLG